MFLFPGFAHRGLMNPRVWGEFMADSQNCPPVFSNKMRSFLIKNRAWHTLFFYWQFKSYHHRPPSDDWFRSTGGRFLVTEIWYSFLDVHNLRIWIFWNKLLLTISFELRKVEIWNRDTEARKLLKYIILGLVIDWKCTTSRIYN